MTSPSKISASPALHLAEALGLPSSVAQLLVHRGLDTFDAASAFLHPSLEQLESPHAYADMETAVRRLLMAVRAEQPIAIYADRDVDGLTGLAVLVRTLRSIGGTVFWASPVKGRGLEREGLERLVNSQAKVIILVDCGTGEHAELEWLGSQNVDVIIADHHRLSAATPDAPKGTPLAWIHPGMLKKANGQTPAGCVMAFKLAQAVWLSFLGNDDPERMDYFLFSHLDLISLGILADRVPLQGENRILVWHGLRRLAYSRKVGIAALTRFFRLTPRSGPLTVREVTWQLIPLLNAGGRLGRPDLTAELLVTEDPDTAHACLDQLIELNTQRRAAQDKSLSSFEKAVLEQCSVETDAVLVALAEDLEPSVTGLAAQSLVRKYSRPAFLFVRQGEHSVGSGRGLPGVDLFAWVEAHREWIVKYGGHQGAVGLTIRTADFELLRAALLATARKNLLETDPLPVCTDPSEVASQVEVQMELSELNEFWWTSLERLAPFGMAHPLPLFQINGTDTIASARRRRSKNPLQDVTLKKESIELRAQVDSENLSSRGRLAMEEISGGAGAGPWTVVGYPVAVRGNARQFCWKIRDMWRTHV